MTQPPGEPGPESDPYGRAPYEQPGYWEQQAQQHYGQPGAQGVAGPQYPPAPGQPYGPPGYGYGYAPAPPTHGTALASMIVGIVALVLSCGYGIGLLASPVAWYLGARAKREIDASYGQLGGRGMAQAGFVLGIIGTVFLVLGVLAAVALLGFAFTGAFSTGP